MQCGQAAPDAKPPVREHPRYCLSRRCERTLAVVSLNGFLGAKAVAPLFELAESAACDRTRRQNPAALWVGPCTMQRPAGDLQGV
eukprot:scaffold28322_cov37-Phaeocystis_antarctica.AAC.1